MMHSARQNQQCLRCGKCCRKGGPSLHLEDKPLIEKGHIPLTALFTIRAHEPVHDNVRNMPDAASSDIIKIRGTDRSWTCRFYDQADSGCTIYAHRPVECRVLTCWDTRKIEAIYNRNRLTRKDVVGHIQGLRELIADHQKQCDYREIAKLIQNAGSSDDASRLNRIIRYDLQLREQIVQKGLAAQNLLDFLLGRPLSVTLAPWGIRSKASLSALSTAPRHRETSRMP